MMRRSTLNLLRRRTVAIAAVTALLGVAACSSSKPSASSESNAGQSGGAASDSSGGAASASPATGGSTSGGGDRVKLVLWEFDNGPDTPSMTKIINAFNSSQSKYEVQDVNINYQTLGQKILVSIAAGGKDGPGIWTTSTDSLGQFVQQGAVANLDDFYSDGSSYPNAQALLPAVANANAINGHHYAMPENYFDEMMCYNKDIFAKAGLTPPTTWDEFAADASKLTVIKNGKPVQYAIALGDQTDTAQFWQPLLWNGGGGVVSDDGKTSLLGDPKTISALEFWVHGVKDLHWSPIGDQGPAAQSLFTEGKAAMFPCGPWVVAAAQDAKINLGLAPMPSGPAGNFPWAGSIVFAVPSTDTPEQKAAAEAFGDFWNSKASQIIFSSANGYPTTRSDVTPDDIPSNPYVGTFASVAATSKFYLVGVSAGTQINNDIFIPTLDKALAGQGSVKDLFTAASKQAQALLDKNQ
jgi:multiple sugar transport system substrate-binding protein